MHYPQKSSEDRIAELDALQQRVSELETVERERDQLRGELDRLLLHRHAIRALEGERTRAHLYFQMAGVMLVVLDQDGNITRLNQKGHEILEYPDGELLGEHWFQTCVPVDEREPLWSRFLKLMAGDQSLVMADESLVVTRTGHQRLMAWQHTRLVDDQGQPMGTLSSGTDITDLRRDEADRRRAEEILRQDHEELEQRVRARTAELLEANARLSREIEERKQAEDQLEIFRRFAETSGQGFGISDLQGFIRYANPAMCRMIGDQLPDAIIGRHFSEFTTPDYAARTTADHIPPIVRGEGWRGEGVLRTREGLLIPTENSGWLIRDDDGQPAYLATVITDIRERKAAEQVLRDQHQELRAICDGVVDALVVADGESMRVLRVNPAARQMFGYPEAELLGLTIRDLAPREWMEFAGKKFAEMAQLDGRGRVENIPMQRKDGSVFFADLTSNRIVWQGRTRMLGLIRDITERKAALEALQCEQDSLRKLLAADDRERQVIAYDIHDGLAHFLVAASMNLETYERRRANDAETAEGAFQIARRMLQEGLAEVRRLCGSLRPPKIDERGVVVALDEYLQDTRYYGGIEIEFVHDVASQRFAPFLENAVARIIQEGVTNARRHSQSPNIRVQLVQRGDRLQLEVRDWGRGFRLAEVQAGSFGLEGMQARARLLGGTVTITSEPGHGTCVQADLPALFTERSPVGT
jgi:PAS domain S-box-containing protein